MLFRGVLQDRAGRVERRRLAAFAGRGEGRRLDSRGGVAIVFGLLHAVAGATPCWPHGWGSTSVGSGWRRGTWSCRSWHTRAMIFWRSRIFCAAGKRGEPEKKV